MHFRSASVCLRKRSNTWVALAAIGLASCGGGGSSDTSTPAPLTIGGSISGLTGSGLVLQNNGGNDLVVAFGTSSFQFSGTVQQGAGYSVTVKSQPHSPLQSCSVTNGSGAVGGSAVSSVAINCRTWTPRFAYVANGGDSLGTSPLTYGNASISGYSISASSGQAGALTPLTDSPFAGAGPSSGPIAIASDPQGRFVFVHNARAASISAYAADAVTGALTPAPGSPYSSWSSYTPKMLVDPTGTFLILGVNDSNGNSSLWTQVSSINQTDGSLSQSFMTDVGNPNGEGALSIVMDPSGTLLFVGSVAVTTIPQYCRWGLLSVLSLDRSTGRVSQVAGSPYSMPNVPGSLAIDPVSQRLYASNVQLSLASSADCPADMTSASTNIAGYSYDSASGVLTAIDGSPFGAATGGVSGSLAIDPAGTYAYALSSGDIAIQRYAIDATTGVLNASGAAVALGGSSTASSILIDQSGGYLYALSPSAQSGQPGQIYGFAVDFNNGDLTPLPGSPFATGVRPNSITIVGGFQ